MKKITKNWKSLIVSFSFILYSATSIAQVDLIASVNDATPPLSNGQNFTYVLVADASENYRGLQVTLNYDPALIQAVSLNPIYSFQVELANNINNTIGEIQYAAGNLTSDINGTETVFEIVFNVIDNSSNINIMHNFSGALGTAVSNASGQDVIGSTNSIIFETLHVTSEDFKNSVSLYPNPVKNSLNIKTSISFNISEIGFYSLNGKLVFYDEDIKMLDNHLSFDTTNILQNGVYLMTLTTKSGEKATYKIVIEH